MRYFAAVTDRDRIRLPGLDVRAWDLLDVQPDGWLTSLAYPAALPAGARQMGDCGAWAYRREDVPVLRGEPVTPAGAVAHYLRVLGVGGLAIAPDHMLIPGLGDLDERRRFNRAAARAFLPLAWEAGLVPMAAVHGETVDERVAVAGELAGLGYRHLALGGLAGQASRRTLCADAVAAVREATPGLYLHVLGLSAPAYVAEWRRLGVDACDGASHYRQAFSGVFFRAEAGALIRYAAVRPGETPTAPLCDCRPCRVLRAHGVDTRSYGSNATNMGRAWHNLAQLLAVLREPAAHPSRRAQVALELV